MRDCPFFRFGTLSMSSCRAGNQLRFASGWSQATWNFGIASAQAVATAKLKAAAGEGLDSGANATGLCKPDLHVFAKLFEDCLKRGLEAQAFSGREIGGHDDVLDFLVGHFVDVDLTRQPAS